MKSINLIICVLLLMFGGACRKPNNSQSMSSALITAATSAISSQPTSALSSATNSPEQKSGYFIIGFGSRNEDEAIRESKRRNAGGFTTKVIDSSEWENLTPAWFIVVYGIYDSKTDALSAVEKLKAQNINVYAKHSGEHHDQPGDLETLSKYPEGQTPQKADPPSTAVSPASSSRGDGKLTADKLEGALAKWISSINAGGSARVIGIQESNNSASADIQFNNFRFKVRSLGRSGLEERTFSGGGLVTLIKYNDGRWILSSVYTNQGAESRWQEGIGIVVE